MNFQRFKLDFKKAEEPEIKLSTSTELSKQQESSRKHLLFIDYNKDFDCGSQQTAENSKRDGNTRPPYSILRNLYVVQKATGGTGYGTTDWFQIGKGVHPSCILSPCLFSLYAEYIMRNAGLGWRRHKLESRLSGEISTTSDMQLTPPLWQKVKKN